MLSRVWGGGGASWEPYIGPSHATSMGLQATLQPGPDATHGCAGAVMLPIAGGWEGHEATILSEIPDAIFPPVLTAGACSAAQLFGRQGRRTHCGSPSQVDGFCCIQTVCQRGSQPGVFRQCTVW